MPYQTKGKKMADFFTKKSEERKGAVQNRRKKKKKKEGEGGFLAKIQTAVAKFGPNPNRRKSVFNPENR